MVRSEIEMYISRNSPVSFVQRYGCVKAWALALVCMVTMATPTIAASPQVVLFADRDLGAGLTQAVGKTSPDPQQTELKPSAMAAACAGAPGVAPRLALLSRAPTRVELDRCAETASAEVNHVTLGRQAVALVVPIGSPVWSVDTSVVFRALGRNGPDAVKAKTWADLDPGYPALPIGVLMPPAGSRAGVLFDALVMEPGCNTLATARTPFERKSRASYCAALRNDIPLTQRQGEATDVGTWAAAAPAGQVAVVSVSELRQLDRSVVPLLIDNALPTAANVETGRYPAAERVSLLLVVPRGADPASRTNARNLAFGLLSEASIGPAGSLAPAGLIPLPPADRLAARTQAIAFLEQR